MKNKLLTVCVALGCGSNGDGGERPSAEDVARGLAVLGECLCADPDFATEQGCASADECTAGWAAMIEAIPDDAPEPPLATQECWASLTSCDDAALGDPDCEADYDGPALCDGGEGESEAEAEAEAEAESEGECPCDVDFDCTADCLCDPECV